MRPSISTRIFLAILVVGLTPIGVSVYALGRSRLAAERLAALREGLVPLIEVASRATAIVAQNKAVLDRVVEDRNPTVRYLAGQAFLDAMGAAVDQGRAAVAAARAAAPPEAADPALGDVAVRLDELDRLLDRYHEGASALEAAFESADEGACRSTRAALVGYNREIEGAVRILARVAQAHVRELADQVLQEERSTVWVGAILAGLAFLLSAVVSLWSVRLLRPLRALAAAARALSRGDFASAEAVPAPTAAPGEIGALATEFVQMARSLGERDERLAAERRFHENIVASLEAGVVVVDASRRMVSANPAAHTLFGLAGDAVGRAAARTELLSSLADEGSRRALETALDRVRGGGPPVWLSELPYGARLVTVSVSPLADGQALLLANDVTEEVRTKQRVVQSERLAAVGRLAAQVAHEIRNPLSSIALNVELLEEEMGGGVVGAAPAPGAAGGAGARSGPGRGEARAILESIQREVERLTAITEEYLRYARLPRPRLRRGELNGVLRALCDFMAEELATQSVALEVELAPELPAVRADEQQLRQAFLNVMRNSQEAMRGGGRLSISTRAVSAGVEVRFVDTGEGIADEHLSQVFEPFFSTKPEGTGLGLAVTRQIVEEHGGSVRIESERTKGTALTVTLPAATDALDAAAPPELEEPRVHSE